jgi:ABC-type transport system involved in multi-copper enzyme maturation permease subunit
MMNWNKMYVIFENTMAKEWRNKFLIFLFALTVGLILLVNMTMDWFNQVPGLMLDSTMANKKLYIFYFIINTWNIFLAIIMGINCVKSDFNEGVYDQILSFPLKRIEYLLSRILGSTAIVFCYYLLSTLLALSVFAFSSEGKVFIDPGLFAALLPNLILIFTAVSLTVLISLFLTKIAAFITTFILVLMISSSNAKYSGIDPEYFFSDLSFYNIIGLVFYFFFPRVGTINSLATDIIMDRPLNISIGWEILHLGLTLGVLYVLLLLVLRKRET